MLKKQMLIMALCLAFVLTVCAQKESNKTDFQKGYNITVDVGSGFNKTVLNHGHFCPGFGIGAGFRYDFHRLWGVSTGLRYEHFFAGETNYNIRNLLIPIEMEFHLPYFYVRGGVVLGVCFDTWVASNAKEVCNLGATLGVGGRIPLTKKDKLTIGLHGTLNNVWEIVYKGGSGNYDTSVSHSIKEGMPRYVVMLRIGYEHRF